MSSPEVTDETQSSSHETVIPSPTVATRPAPDPVRLRELDEALTRFEGQKRWQDVIKTLQAKAEILADAKERVAAWERVAGIYLERFSNQAEAIKAYEAVLDIEADNAAAHKFLKEMYEKRRDWDKLLGLLRREASGAPEAQRHALYVSMAKFVTEKVKRPDVCIEMWEEVRRGDPASADALAQLAALYERQRDYNRLGFVLREQAAQAHDPPVRINLLVKLGMIAVDKLSDDTLAVEAWKGVLALDANDRRAQEALKKRYLAMHAWDELEGFYAESARWDELIRVLERETENPAADAATKVQLFAKIAELWADRKDKVDRAVKYLEKVLELDPHHRRSAVRLAPIYAAAHDSKRLAGVLEVKLLGDTDERVATLRELGALYEGPLKEPVRAFERYRDAFLGAPMEPQSLADVERSAGPVERWSDVVEALSTAMEAVPDVSVRVALDLHKAMILAKRLGRVDEAIGRYDAVLSADPTNAEALAAQESLLRSVGRWRDLLGVLERRLDLATDGAARRGLMQSIAALCEVELSDPARAVDMCLAIVAESGDDAMVLAGLDRLYNHLERWDDLALVLERELALPEFQGNDPGMLDLRYRLGRVYEQHIGRGADAVGVYREILSVAPDHDGARTALEQLLRDPDLRGDAARILEPIYEARGDWEALIRSAEILLVEEDQVDARVSLLTRIGDACGRHIGDPARAFDAYGRAFQEDPGRPEVRDSLATIAGSIGAWGNLVTLFRSAAESADGTELGRVLQLKIAEVEYQKLGSIDRAVTAYERILTQNPGDADAIHGLEGTYASAGRWRDLLGAYRRRMEVVEDTHAYDDILASIADVHEEKLNDPDAAIAAWREMFERDPGSTRALAALNRLYGRLGRWSDLADNLQTRISIAATPEEQSALMLQLAAVRQERMSDVDGAIEIYRQVLDRDAHSVVTITALEGLIEQPAHAAQVAEILEPVYRETEAYDRLAKVFEVLARDADPARKVELLHRIAEIQETALEDGAAAFGTLTRALAQDAARDETLEALDRLSRTMGNHTAFLATLDERIVAMAGTPTTQIALHQRAAVVAEERLEDLVAAIAHRQAILALDPRNLDAATALERLYQLTDRPGDLAQVFLTKAGILDDVEDRKAYLQQASELYETVLEQPERAIEAYRQIAVVDPEDVSALDALIRLFIARSQWVDLLAVYEKKADLLADPAEKKRLYFEVASVFETELKDIPRAIDAYNKVLELDPDDIVAVQRLDQLYTAQGNWRELLGVLDREADLSGDANEVAVQRYRIAEIHEKRLGDVARAVDLYREILDGMPDHAPTLAALEGVLHGPVESLSAAAVLEPVLTAAGAYEKVADVLEVQFSHADDNVRRVEILQRLAEIQESVLDNPRAALEAYARAVPFDPGNESTLGSFERLADAADAWPRVAQSYDAAVSTLTDDPGARVELLLRVAQAYETHLGDLPSAIERYRAVLASDPGNAPAVRALDRLYSQGERWSDLTDVLRREVGLSELTPDEALDTRYRLAQVLDSRLGDVDSALAVYREILDVQMDHALTVAALEAMFARGVRQREGMDLLDPIYRMGEEWEKLASLGARGLDLVTDPAERLAAIHRLAELAEERLADSVGAMEWHARALREQPLDERSLEESERLAAATGEWAGLTNTYADIVEAESSTDAVRQTLGKRLARIHEEELQDLESAEAAYSFVLEVVPLDVEALDALDRIYTAGGNALKLADILDRRAQATGDADAKTEFIFRLAEILQSELQQTDQAIARYRSIVEELDARHAPSLDALENLYLQSERWQDLYDVYQRKLEIAQDDVVQAEIYARMASLADQYLGRSDDAVKFLEHVLTLRGEDSETLAALAGLHEAAGRFQDLADTLERQLASESDDERRTAIALRIPGVFLHQIRDVDRAVEGYKRVLDIDPGSFDALRALAEIYRAVEHWDELVATLQTTLSLGTGTLPDAEIVALYAELGALFWDTLHQGSEAVTAWQQVLDLDSNNAAAIEALLTIHNVQEEWSEVVEVLQKKSEAASIDEARIPVLLQIAEVWETKLGDRDGARAAYEKILEIDPVNDHAYASLEALHREHERWEDLAMLDIARHDKLAEDGDLKAAVPLMREAARLYDEKLDDREQAFAAAQIAFEEDVGDEETVAVLEHLAGATGKWNDLLKATMDAYKSEPVGARRTHLGLHVARWYGLELGHPEWAIPIYNQILAAEPDNLKALQAMGALYAKTQQWSDLARTLQRCVGVARTPDDRRKAYIQYGEVLERHLGQVEQAIEQYNSALGVSAGDREALTALARVYGEREDWAPLVDILRQSVTLVTDTEAGVETRLQIGEILEDRLDDNTAAIQEYAGVLEIDPANLRALRGLERLYARLNQPQDLLRVLESELDVVPTERERVKLLARIAEMLEEEFVRPADAIQRHEQILEIDPGNDGALRGLERLYRQAAQWNELIATLERHLTATTERRDRVPLFEAMGRVYADEIHDLDHAEDAWLNVVQIDGEYVPALEALAQIYEQKGDWHRALEQMEQLAGLLTNEPARLVDLRHRMGRIAEESLQDEARAMEIYQSVLDVDPDHAATLASLRAIAVRSEDWHDVSRYLDREQAVTGNPRARAKLLAELGRVSATYLDDPERATECYAEAIKADPDLEEAAFPLAVALVGHAQWQEAEPLVEMLSRKVARRDPAEQLQIQMMAGQVAWNLKKLDRAIKAFTAAQALDRANTEAIRSLANAYFDKADWENAFKNYQLLLVHYKEDLDAGGRADLYHHLGVVKREQNDRKRAVNFLDKALEEVPGYKPALEALIATYTAGGEWEQVIACKSQLLDQEFEDDKHVAALLEIARLWQEKVGNLQKSIASYAAALEYRPNDRELLHKLLELYQETRQWSKLIEIVQRIAALETDPVRKSRYAYTIATIYNQEIKNPDEALIFYNEALDLNPSELKPFAKVNEILTARKDFKQLERNFRKMLHRVAGKTEKDLEFNLLHNLGVIYRDRLGQSDAAIKAFTMASERQPDNVTEHKILAELYTTANDVPNAVQRWYTILQSDIGNADALHAVFELYYRARQYDKAWCVAATGAFLLRDRLRQDARDFYEQYKPRRPLQPTGRLTEEHWVKSLFHPDEDPVVGKIFAAILSALRKAKVQPVARFGFTSKEQQDPATSSVALVKSLGTAATALSLPTPWIFLRPTQPGGLGHVPSDPIASFGGAGVLSGLSPQELAFVAAKHMAYYRNEHYIRVLFPTVQEITAILLAAIKIIKTDQDVPAEALATAQQLGPLVAQDPVASEGLRKVIRVFLEQGGASNVKKWYQSVELTSARAGFLLTGDLDVAKKMLSLEPGLPGDVPPNEKLKDVILFSLSENYFTLREALGINFQSAAGY